MGIGKVIKKVAVGTVKIAGTAVLGTIGTASTIVEYLGAGSNIELLEGMGHGLKSASFNGVRKMWGAEAKEFDHSAGDAGRRKANEINKEKEKLLSQREIELTQAEQCGHVTSDYANLQRSKIEDQRNGIRRTDAELNKDQTGVDRPAKSFERDYNVPLSAAKNRASDEPGVYILWLNGIAMKCGRSSQTGGIRKRLQEYYRLDYDNRAKEGDCWAITEDNRDDVVVSWQCCPISKCHELEYKLFIKYGKGPWAQRAPNTCEDDSWELLI